jgi:hypothetical protein
MSFLQPISDYISDNECMNEGRDGESERGFVCYDFIKKDNKVFSPAQLMRNAFNSFHWISDSREEPVWIEKMSRQTRTCCRMNFDQILSIFYRTTSTTAAIKSQATNQMYLIDYKQL